MPLKLTPNIPPYYEIVDGPEPAGTKTYVALLTQTGTNAPVATILKNEIEGVWTRQAQGKYRFTKTGQFLHSKVWYIGHMNETYSHAMEIYRISDDVLEIATRAISTGAWNDDSLFNSSIQITVYP